MFLEEKRTGEQSSSILWDRERFCAWLEQKPRDEQYIYCSNGHCLIAQWLRANGWKDPVVFGGPNVEAHNGVRGSVSIAPDWLWHVARDMPRTFGAALARVRVLSNA